MGIFIRIKIKLVSYSEEIPMIEYRPASPWQDCTIEEHENAIKELENTIKEKQNAIENIEPNISIQRCFLRSASEEKKEGTRECIRFLKFLSKTHQTDIEKHLKDIANHQIAAKNHRQNIKYVKSYVDFQNKFSPEELLENMMGSFVGFLNFLSENLNLVDAEVKEFLKNRIKIINRINLVEEKRIDNAQTIITFANTICNYDTLFNPDISEINSIAERLKNKEKYEEFQEEKKEREINKTHLSLYFKNSFRTEIAYRLVRYLHTEKEKLAEEYERDRKRKSVEVTLKESNSQAGIDPVTLSTQEKFYTLRDALTQNRMNVALIDCVEQNLHQYAATMLHAPYERMIAIAANKNNNIQEKMKCSNNKTRISVSLYKENPDKLDLTVLFYRKNNNTSNGNHCYEGSYSLQISGANQSPQRSIPKTQVKLLDFQFHAADKDFYNVFFNDKIQSLLDIISNGDNLTSKDWQDIYIILLPYLKLEIKNNNIQIIPDLKNLEDKDILFLMLSMGGDSIIETCKKLKNKKLSIKENILFRRLLGRVLYDDKVKKDENYFSILKGLLEKTDIELDEVLYPKLSDTKKQETLQGLSDKNRAKKEEAFWPSAFSKEENFISFIDDAKPLGFFWRFAEICVPDSIINYFPSFFSSIINKNKALDRLEKAGIDAYLAFLRTANQKEIDKIWKDETFIKVAKNIVNTVDENFNSFFGNTHVELEPLCSHFLKLAYFSEKSTNGDFKELKSKASRFINEIFETVVKDLAEKTPSEMDYRRLELFKRILKTEEFFSLFDKLKDPSENSPLLLLRWVQIFKDPELSQLIFKHQKLLALIGERTMLKIINDVLNQQKSLEKVSIEIEQEFTEEQDNGYHQELHQDQSPQNSAVELFLAEGKNSLEFKTWYHPEICSYLLQMANNKAECICFLFSDFGYGNNNTDTFKKQLQQLVMRSYTEKKPVLFISKEPGAENHFICGLIKDNKLLLINPLGITSNPRPEIYYKTLAELQKENIIKEIWLSSNSLQKHVYEEEGLVSCGPITLEIATYILTNFTPEEFAQFWANNLKACESKTHDSSGLVYHEINVNNLLPDILQKLSHSSGQFDYRNTVCDIRKIHCEKLQILPVECAKQLGISVEEYLSKCCEKFSDKLQVDNLIINESSIGNEAENIEKLESHLENPGNNLTSKIFQYCGEKITLMSRYVHNYFNSPQTPATIETSKATDENIIDRKGEDSESSVEDVESSESLEIPSGSEGFETSDDSETPNDSKASGDSNVFKVPESPKNCLVSNCNDVKSKEEKNVILYKTNSEIDVGLLKSSMGKFFEESRNASSLENTGMVSSGLATPTVSPTV